MESRRAEPVPVQLRLPVKGRRGDGSLINRLNMKAFLKGFILLSSDQERISTRRIGCPPW